MGIATKRFRENPFFEVLRIIEFVYLYSTLRMLSLFLIVYTDLS